MSLKSKKDPTSFRFSPSTAKELLLLCAAWGVRRGEAVARAIALAATLEVAKNGQKK